MFSVENTRALALGMSCSICLARSIAMMPAEHPIPDKLYTMILDFILKWLTIMADNEGVGLNRLQLTMRISIWLGFSPVQAILLYEHGEGKIDGQELSSP